MPKMKLEKLLEQREVVNARIRREQARARTQARKDDTRRKVLVGAAVLERAAKDETARAELLALLGAFLIRDHDRALFGLGEREEKGVAPASLPPNPSLPNGEGRT